MADLAREVGDLLRRQGLTLGVVESAIGGLISHLVTNIPGSSDYYKGSVTAYRNEVKVGLLGVQEETIDRYGVVSAPVAEAMACGGSRLLGVDVCLADTGIAGPGGATPTKPVGLFFLGLYHRGRAHSREHRFSAGREQNKRTAAEAALRWLRDYLLNGEDWYQR